MCPLSAAAVILNKQKPVLSAQEGLDPKVSEAGIDEAISGLNGDVKSGNRAALEFTKKNK